MTAEKIEIWLSNDFAPHDNTGLSLIDVEDFVVDESTDESNRTKFKRLYLLIKNVKQKQRSYKTDLMQNLHATLSGHLLRDLIHFVGAYIF